MKISGPGESPLLLLRIIKLLNKLRIPYAIVGAMAASFYGLVRASLDADVIISIKNDRELLSRLMALLKADYPTVHVRRGDHEDPIGCVINIEDSFKNRVDLLIGIRGMGEDVFDRIKSVLFLKTRIKVIGIEDFIAMKIFAGGAKDIQDIVGVLQVSQKEIDLLLLRKLTRQYGKRELNKLEDLLIKWNK